MRNMSPAVVVAAACTLKVLAFGLAPMAVFQMCSVFGVSVPIGPGTLFQTIPALAIVCGCLWAVMRVQLDFVASVAILIGCIAALALPWMAQRPLPPNPRRPPAYVMRELFEGDEGREFKEASSAAGFVRDPANRPGRGRRGGGAPRL